MSLAADEAGVLSVGELHSCGLTRSSILTRARRGQLFPKYHGVYAVGRDQLTFEGEMLAAVKACMPHAFLGRYSASILWEILEPEDRLIDVLVVDSTPRSHPGIPAYRTSSLERHEWRRHRGVPVTAPLRTVLDLAAVAPPQTLRAAVRRAQSERLIHHRQLARALREWRGRRGIRNLRKIIATGPAPTRTELEDLVYDLIVEGGFEPPDVNKPLVLDGRPMIPDFRWPAQRLIVEADGRKWHDNPVAREDDSKRQALLEAHGERVLRVTWEQALDTPELTHQRIAQAGAPREAGAPRARRVSPALR